MGRRRCGLVFVVWVLLLFVAVFSVVLNVPVVSSSGNSWVWVGDTVTGAYGEAVAGTGEDIYIARGTSFYRYRPTDGSWVAMATPPSPDGATFKTGTALAWDSGNYIYALYGAAGGESRRWFYRYSISGNSWEALADTPADQGEGDAITWVSLNSRIYATIGGEERSTYFVRYDPSTNTWSDAAVADPPAGMGDGASLVWASSNYLYALRGEFYETTALYDFWRYSITSNVWTAMADIPADPHDGGVGGVGDGGSLLYIGLWLSNQTNFIYALSGNQAYPESPQPIPDNRFYRYTISTNSWERLADLPFGVGYYVGSRLSCADGHIYAWQGTPSTWVGGGDDLARYELPSTTLPRTWTVDDDGSADFSKVQDAINAASPGDTIYVFNGTYYENVVVNKTVSLIGEHRHSAIIDARAVGDAVRIEQVDNVTVTNFTIRHGDNGVYLSRTQGSIIRNNNVTTNLIRGILAMYSTRNNFQENIVNNSWQAGIDLAEGSTDNIIQNNIITDCGVGIYLRYNNGNNTVQGNKVQSNSRGINVGSSNNNRIIGNALTKSSDYGILVEHSNGNEAYDNIIANNRVAGIKFTGGNDNKIYHNNLIDNAQQVLLSISFNIWDDGYPSGGNYWSDYIGQDQDGDGIGDTPYIIDANNQDRYPLMYQWPDTTPPTGSISIAGGASYTNSLSVTLTLFAEDASGVTKMRFSHDNITWTPWETYFTSKTWVLTTGDGTKTVYVQYRDKAGLISPSYQDTIILDATKPTANAGTDQTVNEDILITFDASASTDENGIATYTWSFTDVTPQTLTGKNPTYTFQTPGTYTITLNVTDAAGNWATDTTIITVLDVTKPVANAGQNQTVNVGATVNFDAGDSSDNVGITSYEWNFGDGTTGTGITITHTYANPGTYIVTLTVKDAANNSATHQITVTVRSAEAFPMWMVGAGAAITAIGIAIAATLLLRKRK